VIYCPHYEDLFCLREKAEYRQQGEPFQQEKQTKMAPQSAKRAYNRQGKIEEGLRLYQVP
jgi:hypothetical protein